METIKKEKVFDAVKMMRETRDKISLETQDMNFTDFKKYLENRLSVNPIMLITKK